MLSVSDYLLTDVIVLGSGIAGCIAAIEACEHASDVILISQDVIEMNGSQTDQLYASAYPVKYPKDNWRLHAHDTFDFGCAIGDIELIATLCKDALRLSWELGRFGINWVRKDDDRELVSLDGHTFPRGNRSASELKTSIHRQLLAEVDKHVGITRLNNFVMTNFLIEGGSVVGMMGLDVETSDITVLTSRSIVLASGGIAGVISSGNIGSIAIAQAYHVGVELIAPEMQFIIKKNDEDVTAAQNMGGIRIDQHCRTNISGLYIAGEAIGGIHGANILPGNALTADVVFGNIAGKSASLEYNQIPRIKEEGVKVELNRLRKIIKSLQKNSDHELTLNQAKYTLINLLISTFGKELTWDDMNKCLEYLNYFTENQQNKLGNDQGEITTQDLILYLQLEGLLSLAKVVLKASIARQESRGIFKRADFPEMAQDWGKNIISTRIDNQDIFTYIPVVKNDI